MATGDLFSASRVDLLSEQASVEPETGDPSDSLDLQTVSELSISDTNENVVHSSSKCDKTASKEKVYDFLVCYHDINKEVANDIYSRLEGDGLRGYNEERDRVLGQYKVSAMEAAIKKTDKILLVLSKDALACAEFHRKVRTMIFNAPIDSLIPIYCGLDKKDRPRMLQHFVDITYEDKRFGDRLLASVDTPRRTDAGTDITSPHLFMKRPIKDQSPSPRSRRGIKVVPSPTRRSTASSLKPSSNSAGGWWSKMLQKRQPPVEEQSYQLKTMRTKSNKQIPKSAIVQ